VIDRQDTLFFVRRRRSSAMLVKIRVFQRVAQKTSKQTEKPPFCPSPITILNDFYTNDEDEEEKRGGAQPHDETPRTLFSNSRLMMMMMIV